MDDSQNEKFARLVEAFAPGATLTRHWPLTGGVSAQTNALEVKRPDGQIERFVVRAHGHRDVARDPEIATHEFRLLQALRDAGLPVPRPVYVQEAGEFFDGQAVVVEFVEGEIVTRHDKPARFIAEMAYWLARIHDVNLAMTDLTFLVANDYHADHRFQPRPDDSPLVQSMCETLNDASPREFRNPPVLLHGDFWRGNLLWHNGELAAIIDWEDAAIGDPIQDLARSRLEIHWTIGEHARERFTSHYLSHRDIDADDLAFWDLAMALGLARDFMNWGLPEDVERQMQQALEQFVQQSKQQLAVDRS